MKTILIASFLAFVDDPTTTTGPTCEEELLECQDELDVAEDAIEAAIYWAESLSSGGGTTGGSTGGAQPCTSQICQIVDACRAERTPDLGKCVESKCSATSNNCL